MLDITIHSIFIFVVCLYFKKWVATMMMDLAWFFYSASFI
jgi:hypothetical protein